MFNVSKSFLAPEMNMLFHESATLVQNLRAIVGTVHDLYNTLPPAPNKTGTDEL